MQATEDDLQTRSVGFGQQSHQRQQQSGSLLFASTDQTIRPTDEQEQPGRRNAERIRRLVIRDAVGSPGVHRFSPRHLIAQVLDDPQRERFVSGRHDAALRERCQSIQTASIQTAAVQIDAEQVEIVRSGRDGG